jgi:hypothetical protein
MSKHYILSLKPDAAHPWERCTVHNPITGERPDLSHIIARTVGDQPGAYLVAVDIQVRVLEQKNLESSEKITPMIPQIA